MRTISDGKIIIDTKIDTSGAEKGIGELSKTAQEGLSSMNKSFLLATGALTGLGIASFKIGSDFEEGMSKVKAVSGATGEEMELLSAKAKEMGAKTKFSARESADAMLYMGMAGWKSQQMIDGLPGIMNLAAASGEELGLVSDIVTDALTAFGLQAKDSAGFADLLASASSNSNTNVSLLGESFKYVAPVAGALGHSAQDTAFALGLMANAGIKGSQSGTALRASLTNLAKPTKAMSKSMDALGISLVDTNGEVKAGKVLYDELREKFAPLTDAQKASTAATLFGKEAMSGMLAVINASDEDYNNLYDNLENSAGSAEEMAKIMQDNLKGSLEELGGALETAGIAFYEKFSGPAKEAVDKVTEVFSELATKLGNGELDNILSGIATALATIGTGLLVFNVVAMITNFIGVMNGTATAIGLVAKAQGIWNALMAMSPIGWIVIAVAAVTAGIIVLWNTNEGFRNAVIGAWNAILATGQAVWGWLVQFFTVDIPSAFQSVLDFFAGIPQWFLDLWTNIKQTFLDGWQAIANFFTETIPMWIEQMFNWFNELPYKIGYALGFALGTIIQWGIDTWNYLATNVPVWINAVGTFFSELPGKIWIWLLNTIDKIKAWGQQTHTNMVNGASNAINAVINWFSTLPSRLWAWLSSTLSRVAEFASSLGSKASEAGSGMVTNLTNAVRDLPSKFANIGTNIVKGVWNGITGMGGWLASKVSGFFNGIVQGAKDAMKIHSPSRVFRDEVGAMMAQGVGIGFEDETGNVQNSMSKELQHLTAKMSATVDYETSKTSTGVIAKNSQRVSTEPKIGRAHV